MFQIQPLISKAILPWFGGAPSVWTTCLLFFQTALFAGYLYAHLLASRLSGRKQVAVHVLLVVIAMSLLHVLPTDAWKPEPGKSPSLEILALLTATVGFPYLLLSASGPLLQRWFSLTFPTRSPYRLYAVSNIGSLLALLSYPIVFEPALTLDAQANWWAAGFVVYLTCTSACGFALRSTSAIAAEVPASKTTQAPPAIGMFIRWGILAMLASSTLMAFTNTVCMDVAVIPFLWVIPLSLYLLSFILCFESDRWYQRGWIALLTCLLIVGLCCKEMFGNIDTLFLQIGLYFAVLFGICMLCHGEVARLRPEPAQLTAYYLTISAGGAAGGLFVAVAAPQFFPDYWELHICLLGGIVVSLWVIFDAQHWLNPESPAPRLVKALACLPFVAVGTFFLESVTNYQGSKAMTRSFYGVLEVEFDEIDNALVMRHGHIIHGIQMQGVGRKNEPTTYYSRRTGVGHAIELQQSRKPAVKIGLVGLGAGTLSTYGREGDFLEFYEINQAVIELAQSQFTFLKNSPAEIRIVAGDARLSLEAQPPQEFDVLVLDAFSGDAIPTHLLTREAFEIYLKHLAPDGIIAVHSSNLYFDLRPVIDAHADDFDLTSVAVVVPAIQDPVDPSSEWILLSPAPGRLSSNELHATTAPTQPRRVLWTDSFSNLLEILR